MSDPAAMRRAFAARVRAGQQLAGLVVKMPAAALLETAAHCGFDFAVVDTEHGPADVEALEHHLRAADGAGLPVLVRVASGTREQILHALDAGAAGIVVPQVNDAEQAERAVRAAHYPPRGTRGFATSTRAGCHGSIGVAEHVENAAAGTVLVVQVEHAAALPHVARIAALDGVDAVFLGPADLSMSLGHPGELTHPLVADAIEQVAGAVLESGAARLCAIAGDEREAHAWRARGARLVVFAAPALITRRLEGLIAALDEAPATVEDSARPAEVQR
jgi:4-hydroxy-2-oxoheptanedioate aldolase